MEEVPGTTNGTASSSYSIVPSQGMSLNLVGLTTTQGNMLNTGGSGIVTIQGQPVAGGTTYSISQESYEEVFKEITKKLYGDDQLAELIDASSGANIIYEAADGSTGGFPAGGVTFLTTGNGTLPPGTIVLQRKGDGRLWSMEGEQVILQSASGEQLQLQQDQDVSVEATVNVGGTNAVVEERWFESEESLEWTPSKIARYNPAQKVFRCVDCDFVGFLSRVAEHWLGNHASLRVFQCPRCPYTSAWARCVRMHLTRQHGETLNDSSMWKENPVLEEVTKYLGALKGGVEARVLETEGGERRYLCPSCPYSTDRRDLYNRHEGIHRDQKPFACYVCSKEFNRADHVKKHFTRMHRDTPYELHRIKRAPPPSNNTKGVLPYSKAKQMLNKANEDPTETISLELEGSSVTIPHLAYFNPPGSSPGGGPLQGIAGVGGTPKKDSNGNGKGGGSNGGRGGGGKKKGGEKMYSCSYCPWQGVDNWCLKRHLNTHIKPFLCALCDYKAARSERLATHVLKVHNKRVCHKCSFLADDVEGLSVHTQEAHQNPLVKTGFNCNLCSEYFELRADLEAHAILEHQKVIVQCDLCDFRTTDELSMEAHLREKHNLQPGMGAVAAAAAAAAAAAIGQSTSTQYQMQLPVGPSLQLPDPLSLDLVEPSIAATVAAVSDAMPPMTFQTDASGAIVPKIEGNMVAVGTSDSARESMNLLQANGDGTLLTTGEEDPSSGALSISTEEPETLCEKCGIEFADEQSLKLHSKWHEDDGPLKSSSAAAKPLKDPLPEKKRILTRPYTCSTCSYTSATKAIMMAHQRAHSGHELTCKSPSCAFITPFEGTLKEHVRSEHIGDCPHCGLRAPSLEAFTYHWGSHHSQGALCSLCVNTYRTKWEVKEGDLAVLLGKALPVVEVKEEGGGDIKGEKMEIDNDVNIDVPLDDGTLGLEEGEESSKGPGDLGLEDCLNNNNNNFDDPSGDGDEGGPPPIKKIKTEVKQETVEMKPLSPLIPFKEDFSIVLEALERKKQWEGLKIIPNFNEILVTAVHSPFQLTPFYDKNNHIKKKAKGLSFKDRFKSHPSTRHRLHQKRNGKGPFLFLLRHSLKGPLRCHSSTCTSSPAPRTYPRRRGALLLHKLWAHSDHRRKGTAAVNLDPYQCDCCSLRFPRLYKALLHKMSVHKEEYLRDLKASQQEDQEDLLVEGEEDEDLILRGLSENDNTTNQSNPEDKMQFKMEDN